MRNAGKFSEDGWLVTGEIGHVDEERRVFVTGRAKDVIIRSGHNIDPQVIEEALLQHPEVMMAAAVGEPDEYAGELPVTFVSLRPGAAVSAPELMAFACKHISERSAFPKRIEIFSTISLTAVGKVYKPELWILACTHVLRERLARTGLRDCLTVTVQDSAQGIVANFVGDKGFDPSEYPSQVSDLMRSFAIEYIIASPKSGKQEPTP